jgi:RimJ/RimL family protein N-acetyltransferase
MPKKRNIVLRTKTTELRSLELNNIEQIRKWRNSEEIGKNFIFRDKITKEQQLKWFKRIDSSENDYFFSILNKGVLVGLTEVKKIDWNKNTGDAGLFIAPEYQNSLIPFESTILLLDFSFYELGLKRINIKVLTDNQRAMRFNQYMGYKEFNSYAQEINNSITKITEMYLDEESYIKNRHKICSLIDI